jgi:hypothetical protein
MSQPGSPDRADLIAMLAVFGDREADAVGEQIGSLELTWLITMIEQQYSVTLDVSDDQLTQMSTVSGAVTVLRHALTQAAQAHG